MMDRSQPISRRKLFGALVRPFARHLEGNDEILENRDETVPRQAVIQGRFCLAYKGGVCFTCSEQCPEPGAITTHLGIPTVHADICTGCGVCHDLCPAPLNAILMMAQPKASVNPSNL